MGDKLTNIISPLNHQLKEKKKEVKEDEPNI
jgi:hypothetical protein